MYQQKLLDDKSSRNAIIDTLLGMLYEKSMETEGHSKRVETHCYSIGIKLKLSPRELEELSLLAILHDIGKVGINPDILKKPGRLTTSEWEEMKRHPEIGYRMVKVTPELADVAEFILSHHERWDGKGYPRGLKGEEIPLVCRILAVIDAYDAMTNDRVYRKAMSSEEAILELQKNAGTQFDSEIVRLFIQILQSKNVFHQSPRA
ncbi:MAG: HD-GYP domain-containing protein [Clostridiaceae bacterium]|nr:HD-GYP domain-containing protein [Clostridiaceae bacterium]